MRLFLGNHVATLSRYVGTSFVAGAVAAVGIGFFTGGLQHFPDSPQRSLWVVPLGFFLSGLGLHLLARAEDSKVRILDRKVTGYLLVGLLSVMCLSLLAKGFFDQNPAQGADGHDHHGGHHDSHHGDDESDDYQ